MHADVFFRQLLTHDFGPFTGVPCSLVKDLINLIQRSSEAEYFTATSEGEAMGIAGGFALAGRLPVVVMQNDGFGNAINPLSSLQLLYNLAALLIITWRGEPGAKPDASQHLIMGEILLDLLTILNIPYSILQNDEQQNNKAIASAKQHCKEARQPYALIVRRGLFDPLPTTKYHSDPNLPLRIDYIKLLAAKANKTDIILGTTGYTGRELKQVIGRPGTFYTAGSMGCLPSIGLALAIEQPERRVFILDGDGALLMKMGTLATIGLYQPANLIHVVFDNGQYESTGGQPTASKMVQFPVMATSSGYHFTSTVDSLADFDDFLDGVPGESGPMLCHVHVQPGTIDDLKRPSQSPDQLRSDFQEFLPS
jgi:phosphonopyruvate decarboxylase